MTEKIKIYADKETTLNCMGRIFKFIPIKIQGTTVFECIAPDDAITTELLKLPGYYRRIPIEHLNFIVDEKDTVLIGTLSKGVNIQGKLYEFKPMTEYPFLVCEVPKAVAPVLLNCSNKAYWLVNKTTMRLSEEAKISEQKVKEAEVQKEVLEKLKPLKKVSFTLKEYSEAVEKSEKMKEDNRTLPEVLKKTYVKDAIENEVPVEDDGMGLKEYIEKHKAKIEPAEEKKKKINKKKIKGILSKKDITVNISDNLEDKKDLIMPDIEQIKKSEVREPEDKIDPSDYNVIDFIKLFKKENYGIEELEYMEKMESKNKNRSTILSTIKTEIKKLKGIDRHVFTKEEE